MEVTRLPVGMLEAKPPFAEIDLAGDPGVHHPLQRAVGCGTDLFVRRGPFSFVRRGPFRSAVPLNAEGAAAPARGCGVRVLDREAAPGHGIDEIDLGALEVTDAH